MATCSIEVIIKDTFVAIAMQQVCSPACLSPAHGDFVNSIHVAAMQACLSPAVPV